MPGNEVKIETESLGQLYTGLDKVFLEGVDAFKVDSDTKDKLDCFMGRADDLYDLASKIAEYAREDARRCRSHAYGEDGQAYRQQAEEAEMRARIAEGIADETRSMKAHARDSFDTYLDEVAKSKDEFDRLCDSVLPKLQEAIALFESLPELDTGGLSGRSYTNHHGALGNTAVKAIGGVTHTVPAHASVRRGSTLLTRSSGSGVAGGNTSVPSSTRHQGAGSRAGAVGTKGLTTGASSSFHAAIRPSKGGLQTSHGGRKAVKRPRYKLVHGKTFKAMDPKYRSRFPRSGTWETSDGTILDNRPNDLRGVLKWRPNPSDRPANPRSNPLNLTFGELFQKYGIDSIEYVNGRVSFPAQAIKVTLISPTGISENRLKNMAQARRLLVKAGPSGVSPELSEQVRQFMKMYPNSGDWFQTSSQVEQFMSAHKLTFHEADGQTFQIIPTDLHDAVEHVGGVSDAKTKVNFMAVIANASKRASANPGKPIFF